MSVAIDQDLDVFKTKTELRDVLLDLRDGFIEAAVEQDVTSWSGNQKRTNLGGADVVHIANDSIWFDWLVPGSALFIWLTLRKNAAEQEAQKAEHKFS